MVEGNKGLTAVCVDGYTLGWAKQTGDMLKNLSQKCIAGINANKERCKENLIRSSAIAATLINEFGYEKISEIVKEAHQKNKSFADMLKEKNIIQEKELLELLQREIGIKIE
jgi:aspartate ammonia-lyase